MHLLNCLLIYNENISSHNDITSHNWLNSLAIPKHNLTL